MTQVAQTELQLFSSDQARAAFTHAERPRNVYWETTIACSLACRHCRAEALDRRDPRELSGDAARALIDSVAELGSMLILTGGDPMERPDLFELIAYARSRRVPVGVTPSTTPKLDRKQIFRLKEAGVAALGLSLDGASAETHDRFRGIPRTFDKAREVLEYAREAGLPVQVNTTVTRYNLAELREIHELLAEHHAPPVKRWSLFLLVPTGRGRLLDLPDALDLEVLYSWMYETSRSAPFHVSTVEAPMYRRYLVQRRLEDGASAADLIAHSARYGLGVRDGNGVIFVSHRGDVYPSGFVPMVELGNVRERPLHEIYRNSNALFELRDMDQLDGKCGHCEFRWLCGGSRARSSSVTGRVMGEEPLCAYRPSGYVSPSEQPPTSGTLHVHVG